MPLYGLIFITAILPSVLLTAFFLAHFRRRLGQALGLWAFVLGIASAAVAIALATFLLRVTPVPGILLMGGPRAALIAAAVESALGAAIPEEVAKFLVLWFVIRRSRACDSGGDLFCSAILVGLGFAAIENVLYLFHAGSDWVVVGLIRGLMSVPGHTIDGMFMGYFLALWWRRTLSTPLALALALVLPMLAHGLYDFPLMAIDGLRETAGGDVIDLYVSLRYLQLGVLAFSGLAAIWVARQELVLVYSDATPDGDLYLGDETQLGRWRWVGRVLSLAGILALGVGVLAWSQGEPDGYFLVGLAMFPLAFGRIMRLRPPARITNPHALHPTALARD